MDLQLPFVRQRRISGARPRPFGQWETPGSVSMRSATLRPHERDRAVRYVHGMALANDDVLRKLEAAFPNGPLTDEQVRGQAFRFFPAHWRDRWPPTLRMPARLRTEERSVLVSRQDVFTRARSVETEDDAVDMYVLMCSWGAGNKAQRVARCAKPLSQPDPGASLLRTYDFVRENDAADAYLRMARGGEFWLKGFGPSFFTKWLYFSAYETRDASRGSAPLILDERVARGLGWSRLAGWSPAEYQVYLHAAQAIRDGWAPGTDLHCIEHALFSIGKMP